MTSLVTKENRSVVIVPEDRSGKVSKDKHLVFQCDIEASTTGLNTFLILHAKTMNKYAPLLIKALKELPKLRTVFLLGENPNLDAFLDILKNEDSKIRSRVFDVLHVPVSKEQVTLMMKARCDGSEDQLIARANVIDDELTLVSFGLNSFRAKFDAVPLLSKIPAGERNNFKIQSNGKRIEWQYTDVSLDLDDFRYHTEKAFRQEQNMRALAIYGLCGEAIKKTRGELSREKIEKAGGPSVKHLGRIESSPAVPTASMLVKLAKAHKLTFEQYLRLLLKTSEEIESKRINVLKKNRKTKT